MKRRIPEQADKGRVLLVDDKPENLQLLAELLTERGYTVQIALSGGRALRAVEEEHPEIVLLDINMPETDGFEVCNRLQDNPATRSIPVIFVTALTETKEKIRGLQLGAVDYVTKPFQIEEVVARLENHLELKRLREELATKVEELEEKNARLNLFSHTLAHDLRNPLAAVVGFSDLLLFSDSIQGEDRKHLQLIGDSGRQINEIVESLLLLATTEHVNLHLEAIQTGDIFDSARRGLADKIRESDCQILRAGALPPAMGNATWVERIWTNYLSNAIKYGGAPPVIRIGADQLADGQIMYWVEDNGDGLAPKQKAKLFVPFSRLHGNKIAGVGLGLVIVKRIVEVMGGSVGVEDADRGGSRFFFTLPSLTANADRKASSGASVAERPSQGDGMALHN